MATPTPLDQATEAKDSQDGTYAGEVAGGQRPPPGPDTSTEGPPTEPDVDLSGLGAQQRALLEALTAGPVRTRDLAGHIGEGKPTSVTNILRRLADRGLVTRTGTGVWALATDAVAAALTQPRADAAPVSLQGLTGYQRDILEVLAHGPARTGDLAVHLGRHYRNLSQTLATLRRRGLATSPHHGIWALAGDHVAAALAATQPGTWPRPVTGADAVSPTAGTARTGATLDSDEFRFPDPQGSARTGAGAYTGSQLATAPKRPWESEQDRPIAGAKRLKPIQTNVRMAATLRHRLDAVLNWLEAQNDEDVDSSEDLRHVYSMYDAINMAVHSWCTRVERDYNEGRPFKARGRRTRRY